VDRFTLVGIVRSHLDKALDSFVQLLVLACVLLEEAVGILVRDVEVVFQAAASDPKMR